MRLVMKNKMIVYEFKEEKDKNYNVLYQVEIIWIMFY